MVLSIIIKNSRDYKKAIQASCEWTGLVDYEILDPKYNSLTDPVALALYIGEEAAQNHQVPSQKSWTFNHLPTPDLPQEKKLELIQILKEAKDYLEKNKLPGVVKPTDIPTIKSLKDFLNNLTGQIVEVRLPDKRRMGIYPDNTKLQSNYDIEFNASVIVNLAKIFHLFDASEIIIKEI